MPEPTLDRRRLEDGLRALGLGSGAIVEMHASLSRLGWVEGGAAAVVDALMAVVGPQGTLVVSAYPLTRPLPLTPQDRGRGIVAKVRLLPPDSREPTGMGAIADELRQRPMTALGVGPHRLCAWGRDAGRYSTGYEHLVESGGLVLLLGVGIGRCSSMHVAERHAGLPQAVRDCGRVPPDILRDYPPDAWYIQYGGTPHDGWQRVWEEALQQGLVRRGCIGRAACALFRAADVVGLYEHHLRTAPLALFGLAG